MTKNLAKKIVITDSYSRNTGDIAILMSMVQSIKKANKNIEIAIEVSNPSIIKKFDLFESHDIYPRIFDIQKYSSSKISFLAYFVLGLYDSMTFLIWAILNSLGVSAYFIIRTSRRDQAKMLSQIDILVSAGGGFLSSYYKWYFRIYIYLIAKILGKKVYIFAQSVGPFNTFFSYFVVPKVLNILNFITIREPDSMKYLSQFRLKTPMLETADIAFLLDKKEVGAKYSFKSKYVAICIKSSGNEEDNKKYVDTMLNTIKYLNNMGYISVIVSQTPADDNLGRAIISKSQFETHLVPFGLDPREVKDIYTKSSFLISHRMHAIIFTSEEYVPFITLSYEPKFRGLMEQMSYPAELLLEGEEFHNGLNEAINYLTENRERIIKSLTIEVPKIKKMALENVKILQEI